MLHRNPGPHKALLAGRPTLRTPEGWRELEQGEVVSFLTGERGAHQLVNWTAETVRFLSFSTSANPDVVVYPDSGKLGAAERRPGGWRLRAMIPDTARVDYWHGEIPPRQTAESRYRSPTAHSVHLVSRAPGTHRQAMRRRRISRRGLGL